MTDRLVLFHGGVAGLKPGDLILPGHAEHRYVDGCLDCEAQRHGHTGPTGDAPTPPEWVYACGDRQYARFYASRAVSGWLYRVELRGDVERSDEDPEQFGCWRGREAVVLSVLERAVRLTMQQRRRLFVRWGGTDREWHRLAAQAVRS